MVMTQSAGYNISMAYTIAELPQELDAALRARARAEGKTLEQLASEALLSYANASIPRPKRDLSFFGSLSVEDAKAINDAHEFCDTIGDPADGSK